LVLTVLRLEISDAAFSEIGIDAIRKIGRNKEDAAMNISSIDVSRLSAFSSAFALEDEVEAIESGLSLLQKHREILLKQTEALLDSTQRNAGCLSELSLVDSVHDSADYQTALKELGDLFKASTDFIFAIEQQLPHAKLNIHHYEDEIPSESLIESIAASSSSEMTDEDLEDLGYLGWLMH
jgi:hypothetical protein